MNTIFEETQRLAGNICQSGVYSDFLLSRQALLDDESVKPLFIRYKKLYSESRAKEPPLSFDEEKLLSGMYWELMLNEKARAYFQAEKEIVKLFSGVYGVLEEVSAILLLLEEYCEEPI